MKATAFECFEIRAKKFERKYGYLPPGKSSPSCRESDDDQDAWKEDMKKFDAIPCICGEEISDDWND